MTSCIGLRSVLAVCALSFFAWHSATAADRPDFNTWKAKLWPEAQRFGIRRQTFDAAFKGLKPDLTLPDLMRPKSTGYKRPGQAEFNRRPQDYVREATIKRLAATGRRLGKKHKRTLLRIEQRFGIPAAVVLAIWGRETAYGSYRLRHDAIRVLATQAYTGRRHEMFRRELLYALKMLDDGIVSRRKFRASWAGAVGLTQFMPSEYDTLAVDLDGDGRKDIWSVPDALASAANQLKQKGWQANLSWGYEVILPATVTCAEDGPKQARPISEWDARGVRRVAQRKFRTDVLDQSAFLFSPGGSMGPVFLATENFLVFKRYNMSDLYALFVGHLADRIAGAGRFVRDWSSIKQLPREQIAAIQTVLRDENFAIGKIDGRIGPNTRSQIGRYQQREKLAITCWPSADLLKAMRQRAGKLKPNAPNR